MWGEEQLPVLYTLLQQNSCPLESKAFDLTACLQVGENHKLTFKSVASKNYALTNCMSLLCHMKYHTYLCGNIQNLAAMLAHIRE